MERVRDRIRVALVDDHAFMHEGIQSRLGIEDDMCFVGGLPSAENVLDMIPQWRPDLILFDLEMPGPDPFDRISTITQADQKVRVVILSAHIRDVYLDSAVRAGAHGYVSKADSPNELLTTMRRVMWERSDFALSAKVALRTT